MVAEGGGDAAQGRALWRNAPFSHAGIDEAAPRDLAVKELQPEIPRFLLEDAK